MSDRAYSIAPVETATPLSHYSSLILIFGWISSELGVADFGASDISRQPQFLAGHDACGM